MFQGEAEKGTAGLLWPTAAMLITLAVLLGLGTWQVQRKAWKEGLLADIAVRTTTEPISLEEAVRRWRAGDDTEYLRVRAAGRFRHDRERFYYAPSKEGAGFHVYTPFETAAGPIVLVNRGFVPERAKDQVGRRDGLPAGEVEVIGLLRAPGERGAFTPANDPKGNLWFWRDLAGMADSALGPEAGRVSPLFLDAEAQPGETWPRGGVTRLDLPNRHLEYALTWYGLALALIGVYSIFVIGRLRRMRFDRESGRHSAG
jgi:surfeit locus 1 family protein